MVIVSCMTKFHAFALAEQLHKHHILRGFYTTYAFQKNTYFRKLAKRVDKEDIPADLIHTNIPLASLIKSFSREFTWNDWHDKWVASRLKTQSDYKVFIGWSSMSLHSIRQAKKDGKLTILERGSSHILYQDRILREEYKKFGKDFSIHPQIVKKELREYEEVDFISIPSMFVKNSFLEMGVPESKLILNNYGSSAFFKKDNFVEKRDKFTILYLGSVSIRKGLIYLFKALSALKIEDKDYEVWFIGGVNDEMRETINQYNRPNWHWKGHIGHYELPKWISQCDVAIQPSLEEGLSMVIAQIMACGVPVIASVNSGGEDIIEPEKTGFIVPIRSPEAIGSKIEQLYYNKSRGEAIQSIAAKSTQQDFTWDNYGNRYINFLNQLL
jgi:glycosyltransferase involved in cell wall biosynthesis